ncbi:Calcineurin-like phosphoesterase [Botrimarina colliarenosi]|uniref:Calcineurin-like phosphoesterase n=1 Tax=Botrimarina colliarenosi TaxID=2528001 RepID=A0A5C6A2Q9_9BACT|nr:metallophosphoesterase [Botrimarina colliarenosi]TWT93481.1 Calcineurin-like phosphoesterase [Botrimarina colliarenosi]
MRPFGSPRLGSFTFLFTLLLLSAARAHGEADPIAPGSWTLAVLPDTQIYAESYPAHYEAQTQWLAAHAEDFNIRFVLYEGDVTNRNTREQWKVARAAMAKLDGMLPYAIAPGNHDYGPGGNASDRHSAFNDAEFFGPGSPYAGQPTLRGCFEPEKTDNTYHRFEAGGQQWLVVALEFAPRDEVVAWANKIVADHADCLAILVTHAYLYSDDTIYDWRAKGRDQNWNPHAYGVAKQPGETVNDGRQLWEKLVAKHAGFRLTFNGHVLNDGTGYRSTEGEAGAVVHQMLANYQFKKEGGQGDLRLLEFRTDGDIVVRTYSPVLDRHDRAADQQFTIRLDELGRR